MIKGLEKIIFFLLVFFISSQVGLHFWPSFSYVQGIRIDYLSPTLYLLDILIIALFLLSYKKVFNFLSGLKFGGYTKIVIILFLVSLSWNVIFSKSSDAHVFGILKLAEFVFLGFYVAASFKKDYIKSFIDALSLSAIVSSTLAIWQYIAQSSIGGLWYFFGERTFTGSTIGISTVNINGQILRSYGAFPHPNVLAFFLFMVIVFVTLRLFNVKEIYEKVFLLLTIFLSTIAIFTTFSRSVIFLLVAFSFYVIYSKIKSNWGRASLAFSVFVLFVLITFSQSLSTDFFLRGINWRLDLLSQSVAIFSNYPYFGIGLNNFFIHQAPLVKSVTPILFQPPHNIYVVVLLSLGIFGWWIFLIILFKAFKTLFNKLSIKNYQLKTFYKSLFIVFLGIIFVGVFDHFFATLEQGQIIFSLILGLAFTRLKD